MVGPFLFGTVLVALTVIEYDFMFGIGWRPVADPAGAWPSGLALGPYGALLVASFVVSGLMLALFAAGLHAGATGGSGSPVGPALLFVAGIAMALMGLRTDSIQRTGPRTMHGLVHDLAFVLFVCALLAAVFTLRRRFRAHPGWRPHANYTLATGMIAGSSLALQGAAYYLFIFTVLAWIEVSAIRLWRTRAGGPRPRRRR